MVDTSSEYVHKHYQRKMKSEREAQLKLFKKLGLDHAVVRTDRPYIGPLRDLFARRARRLRR